MNSQIDTSRSPLARTSNRVAMAERPSFPSQCHAIIYFVVALFSTNANLATNSLWIQLSLLLTQVPEGTTLRTYFIVILEFGNITALVYLIVRRYASQTLSEVPFIYGSFLLSIAAMTVAALFWESSIDVSFGSVSFMFLLCAFLSSLVSCVVPVTYIPYAGKIKPAYVSAVLMGNVWSALIPHIVGFIQGMGNQPDCTQIEIDNQIKKLITKPDQVYGYYAIRTTPMPRLPPVVRFDAFFFYFCMAATALVCSLCFVLLRYACSCLDDDIIHVHGDEEEEMDGAGLGIEDEAFIPGCGIMVDDTVQQSPHVSGNKSTRNQRFSSSSRKTSQSSNSSQHYTFRHKRYSSSNSSTRVSQLSNNRDPKTYPLLMIITFWATCIISGPLSSVKAHACYPTGNRYFLAGTIVSCIVMSMACPFALRLNAKSRVTIVVALTSLGTITLVYFAALIGFSLSTNSTGSMIFDGTGELLGTIAWATISGLFALGLAVIGVVCAEAGQNYLICYCVVYLLGEAVGSLFLLKDLSICKIYQANDCLPDPEDLQ